MTKPSDIINLKKNVGLSSSNDSRLKYIHLTLKKPTCVILPVAKSIYESSSTADSYMPSKTELDYIVSAIANIRDSKNQFRKSQITSALKNKRFKADLIGKVLGFLVHKKELDLLEAESNGKKGRPPLPKYQILFKEMGLFQNNIKRSDARVVQ
jgi:hypothetical protein